jgi:CRP-like cAMP-binding protein
MQLADVKSTPLFAPATRRQQHQIAGLADDIEVPAGTRLTVQGRYAREFFVIADGYAEVRRDGELLATLGPGEFFGELGLLEGYARTATVVAATPMRLLVLAGREFRRLLDVVPAVAAEVEATAGARRRVEDRTLGKESTVRYEEQREVPRSSGAAAGAAR